MPLNEPILPSIDVVIGKIKKLEELTAEEEYVYLINIEHLSEEEANKIIESKKEAG